MRFGICAPAAELEAMTKAGYDYLEPAVTGALQPEQPEAEVMPPLLAQFAMSRLKPEAFNVFLPGELRVVGPETDPERQERYLDSAFRRVKMLGGEIVVFGSGGARQRPEDWPKAETTRQILAFLGRCGEAALRHNVVVAIEPLNVTECNVINSVGEATALAAEVGRPAVGVLSDLYHVAHDGQSYDETRDAAPRLRHVHVAGIGRRAPIADDHDFLTGYLSVLKQIGYGGRISIEANWEDLGAQAGEALRVLKRAWDAA
jgi:D-psicose/D-tagatose/L-ribulose 3-epimerase